MRNYRTKFTYNATMAEVDYKKILRHKNKAPTTGILVHTSTDINNVR